MGGEVRGAGKCSQVILSLKSYALFGKIMGGTKILRCLSLEDKRFSWMVGRPLGKRVKRKRHHLSKISNSRLTSTEQQT